MVINLAAFLQEHFDISNTDLLRSLAEHSDILNIPRKNKFHVLGELSPTLDILVDGLVRGFFPDGSGNEITDCFAFAPGTPLVTSIELGGPSVINLEALTDVTLLSIPISYLLTLMEEPVVLRLVISFLTLALQRHWEVKMVLAQRSTKARYDWFLEKYPGLIDQVSHQYIASFLGVSPVTLSRTRHVEDKNRTSKTQNNG